MVHAAGPRAGDADVHFEVCFEELGYPALRPSPGKGSAAHSLFSALEPALTRWSVVPWRPGPAARRRAA
jgi:hypothetical protein